MITLKMPSWIYFLLVQFEDPVLIKFDYKILLLLAFVLVLDTIWQIPYNSKIFNRIQNRVVSCCSGSVCSLTAKPLAQVTGAILGENFRLFFLLQKITKKFLGST